MERMWINQPSTAQPYHKYHGRNVLWDKERDTVYFTEGETVSAMFPANVLSAGWKKQPKMVERENP